MRTSFIPQDQQECSNCRFYSEDGTCRRHAPMPFVGQYERNIGGWFPAMNPEEWCGEWEPRDGAS